MSPTVTPDLFRGQPPGTRWRMMLRKLDLIERDNPAWNDLPAGLGITPAAAPVIAVDLGTRPG